MRKGTIFIQASEKTKSGSYLKRTSESDTELCPVSPAHRTQKLNLEVSPHRAAGPVSPAQRTEKLNLEVSPHRAVRLMRIEFGGAFADLLNKKGNGSGDNEMGCVERTLGFHTRALDDRDLRLITDVVGGTIR
ncbi:NOL1/NOP2/sun family protein [Actinidia rufa]|uniref:NOL1/NOP2/sun family protein n=1 Tax=Actinidia rufa TaxID=165716 RepID=A0A7J0DZV5_9ERIC|nr:NOL1/NOP2/sun family protein [Actinidia rufa]